MSNNVRVLVICLGNICRSPALEITLKKSLSDNRVKNEYQSYRKNWNLPKPTLEIQDHRSSPGCTQGDGDGLEDRDVDDGKTNSSDKIGIYVESRGLSEKQRGKAVDERVAKELELRGYTVPKTKVSIPVSERDFYEFDYLLAADQKVLETLRSMKPIDAHPVIELASHWSTTHEREIPDPYKQPDAFVVKSVDLAEQYAKDIAKFLLLGR